MKHWCALWLKVPYIMTKKPCNMVVSYYRWQSLKVCYVFLILSVGQKGDIFHVLEFPFCIYVLSHLGYVQTVPPKRASGLQSSGILTLTSGWGLDLCYLPHPMCPGFCRNETQVGHKQQLRNAPSGPSAQTGIPACAKHTLSDHIKTWSSYNRWHFFNRSLICTFPKARQKFVLNVSFSTMRFQLSILNIKARRTILYFNT